MPVLINQLISEFQPQEPSPGNQPESSSDNGAPGGGIDLTELFELQAVEQSRQQRLEVD